MIYDISRPLSDALAGWPGDTPFAFTLVSTIEGGSSCNVGAVSISNHFGTHMDAPYHYLEDGETTSELNPEVFIGEAAVVEAVGAQTITRDLFDTVDFTRIHRVLIRTNAWLDNGKFPARIPTLASDVPDFLGNHGVKLIGVDVPSVDQFDSKSLPVHHGLARNNIYIVESLDLRPVPPGIYELIALPLKIVGGDGSPIRAILRNLPVPIPAGSRRLGQ